MRKPIFTLSPGRPICSSATCPMRTCETPRPRLSGKPKPMPRHTHASPSRHRPAADALADQRRRHRAERDPFGPRASRHRTTVHASRYEAVGTGPSGLQIEISVSVTFRLLSVKDERGKTPNDRDGECATGSGQGWEG